MTDQQLIKDLDEWVAGCDSNAMPGEVDDARGIIARWKNVPEEDVDIDVKAGTVWIATHGGDYLDDEEIRKIMEEYS